MPLRILGAVPPRSKPVRSRRGFRTREIRGRGLRRGRCFRESWGSPGLPEGALQLFLCRSRGTAVLSGRLDQVKVLDDPLRQPPADAGKLLGAQLSALVQRPEVGQLVSNPKGWRRRPFPPSFHRPNDERPDKEHPDQGQGRPEETRIPQRPPGQEEGQPARCSGADHRADSVSWRPLAPPAVPPLRGTRPAHRSARASIIAPDPEISPESLCPVPLPSPRALRKGPTMGRLSFAGRFGTAGAHGGSRNHRAAARQRHFLVPAAIA